MEMGELVAVAFLQDQMDEKCPFNEDVPGATSKQKEDTANDDKIRVQPNAADALGRNLRAGRAGTKGTIKGPYPAPQADKEPARDTKHGGTRVRVGATEIVQEGTYPYTVAAHHLIPGNGSLYNEECDVENYMLKERTIKAAGMEWELKYHIGYNVNGAHNGLWMPGNYALQDPTLTPDGVTWGAMTNVDWQMHYVAACTKATRTQFHDEHSEYNDAVLLLLNLIAEELQFHQTVCKECQQKDHKIPPPYLIKERLYNLSRYFRTKVSGGPLMWRRPWFTSNRWRDLVFGASTRPCQRFRDAYDAAGVV